MKRSLNLYQIPSPTMRNNYENRKFDLSETYMPIDKNFNEERNPVIIKIKKYYIYIIGTMYEYVRNE